MGGFCAQPCAAAYAPPSDGPIRRLLTDRASEAKATYLLVGRHVGTTRQSDSPSERACGRCRNHEARHMMAAAFAAWTVGTEGPSCKHCYDIPWLHQTRLTHATYCHQLAAQGSALRKASAEDRAAYLGDCARKVNAGQDREAVAFAVRRLLNYRHRKPIAPDVLTGLLRKDGSACASPDQIAARWRHQGMSWKHVRSAKPMTGPCLTGCWTCRARHASPGSLPRQQHTRRQEQMQSLLRQEEHIRPLAEKLYTLLLKLKFVR